LVKSISPTASISGSHDRKRTVAGKWRNESMRYFTADDSTVTPNHAFTGTSRGLKYFFITQPVFGIQQVVDIGYRLTPINIGCKVFKVLI
jgi:hypothetical protein